MTVTRLNCRNFGYGCPYPVGDVIMRQSGNDPEDDWPGTSWTEIGQGRFPVGADSAHSNGSTGNPTHIHTTGNFTLGESHIPPHTHGSAGDHRHQTFYTEVKRGSGTTVTRVGPYGYTGSGLTGVTGGNSGTHTHTSVGGGQAHNHGNTGPSTAEPPWFGVRFWRRDA